MFTRMTRKPNFFFALALASPGIGAADLGNGFTYQGELLNNSVAADGIFDFQMKLFGVANDGAPIGSTVIVDNATVTGGVFAVELDFGISPFNGDQLWLDIAVREGASVGGFTGLLPRQKLTATPFALHAEQVAPGSVGSQQIKATQVQKRVTGSCYTGSYVTAVNESGTVSCDVAKLGIADDFIIGSLSVVNSVNVYGNLIANANLTVVGTANVGLERVSLIYDVTTAVANCSTYGNLPCYTGFTTVSCPVGKRVLGGGADGPGGIHRGTVSASFPSSTTSWFCGVTSDSSRTNACFALCARLE